MMDLSPKPYEYKGTKREFIPFVSGSNWYQTAIFYSPVAPGDGLLHVEWRSETPTEVALDIGAIFALIPDSEAGNVLPFRPVLQ